MFAKKFIKINATLIFCDDIHIFLFLFTVFEAALHVTAELEKLLLHSCVISVAQSVVKSWVRLSESARINVSSILFKSLWIKLSIKLNKCNIINISPIRFYPISNTHRE